MSRRRTPPPPLPVVAERRVIAPSFDPVVVRGTATARHCFSTCLYHEPTYAQCFPGRNFAGRYLKADAIAEFLQRTQSHLVIFCDRAMLSTAKQMQVGDIYLVTEPAAFAWAQHIWRYYAALLPQHPTIQAFHFRGLDNVMRDDIAMLDRFLDGGFDLLRAPYVRGKRQIWTPVRGSCSVAHRGIQSLRDFLRTRQIQPTAAAWPEPFHCDERYLETWFKASRDELNTFTYIDRPIRGSVYREIHRALLKGRRVHVEGQISIDGPLRSGR